MANDQECEYCMHRAFMNLRECWQVLKNVNIACVNQMLMFLIFLHTMARILDYTYTVQDRTFFRAFETGDIVCWLVNPPIPRLDLYKSSECRWISRTYVKYCYINSATVRRSLLLQSTSDLVGLVKGVTRLTMCFVYLIVYQKEMLASVQEYEYNVCQSNTLHFRYIFVGDEFCVCIRKKCWQVSQNVNVALRCNRYVHYVTIKITFL